MKTAIILIIILILLLLGAQALISQSTGRTEQQAYHVIEKSGNFEIRHYPPAILASVSSKGQYGSSSGSSFRVLAGYIFGGNEESKKIAMTSPVRMEEKADTFRMKFVMPSEYSMKDLPEPKNASVKLEDFEGGYYATLRFGGYAKDKDWADKTRELLAIIESKGLSHTGEVEYLGYNPPYQFINRRNEVVIRILDDQIYQE